MRHGVMMLGPSGSLGKAPPGVSCEALTRVDSVLGETYVIDAKALTKDELYGTLDPTTLEWSDGVLLTSCARS